LKFPRAITEYFMPISNSLFSYNHHQYTNPRQKPLRYNLAQIGFSKKLFLGFIFLFIVSRFSIFGQVYEVGDLGPADGVIVYVNTSLDDDWWYLEVAVPSTIRGIEEPQAPWLFSPLSMGNLLSSDIGQGLENTQYLISFLEQRGIRGTAAQIAHEYEQNGYDDWFLPSKDELMLVFQAREFIPGLVGSYWSSTPNNTDAWLQDMDGGNQFAVSQMFPVKILPMRRF